MIDRDLAVVAHNLRLFGELQRISQTLAASSIRCVALKGVPLLKRLDLPLSARRLADNDVLVPREQVRAAARALGAIGYSSLTGRSLEIDLRTNYEHPLVLPDHDGGFLVCELHWMLAAPASFKISEAFLWSRIETLHIDGVPIAVLEPRCALLHLAIHAFAHELCEPRTFQILGQAWTRWAAALDHDALWADARALGAADLLAYALSVAHELGLTPLAPPAWASPRARVVRALLPASRLETDASHRYPERYRRWLSSLLLLSQRRALASLAERLLPPPELVSQATSFRGLHVAAAYATRPLRPVLRSFGWRPAGAHTAVAAPGRGSS